MAEYVTIEQLKDLGLNPEAFEQVDVQKKQAAVRAASDLIDGYLGNRFKLPLIEWEDDIRECCAVLASIQLIRNRGTDPDSAQDLATERKERIDWLTKIASGLITPRVTDSSSGAAEGVPSFRGRVVSSSSRGYSNRGTGQGRLPFQGD